MSLQCIPICDIQYTIGRLITVTLQVAVVFKTHNCYITSSCIMIACLLIAIDHQLCAVNFPTLSELAVHNYHV